jgi:hypothetical protein
LLLLLFFLALTLLSFYSSFAPRRQVSGFRTFVEHRSAMQHYDSSTIITDHYGRSDRFSG